MDARALPHPEGQTAPADPLLTVLQLARLEGVTERHVRWLIATKGLPHYKRAGIRIRWSEYQAWMAGGRRVAGGAR